MSRWLQRAQAAAEELGEDGFADSDGVKIHYVTAGKGPLVVLIHGFPDFWYTWRAQMPELAKHFQVVAIDMRGYNKSDQPEGVENYAMPKLVGDIDAVVKHFKADKAIIVGHDWGGMVAWTYAMTLPDKTDKLVILNLPHPKGLARELANNPAAAEELASTPATSRSPTRPRKVTPEMLTFWVKDPEARRSTSRRSSGRAWKACSTTTRPTIRASRTPTTEAAKYPAGQVPGADVPRAEGHGLAARRAQRHLEVGGQGPDAGHDSRSRPLRAAGRGREGDQVHGRLADDEIAGESSLRRAIANHGGNRRWHCSSSASRRWAPAKA